MIERWLQISCDVCDETDSSTTPNMTIAEFMTEVSRHFRRFGRRHLCRSCATREGRSWISGFVVAGKGEGAQSGHARR